MRRRVGARCECFPLCRTCREVDRTMRTILFVARRSGKAPRCPPITFPAKPATSYYQMVLHCIHTHNILHTLLMAIAVVPSLRWREVFTAAHL